MAVDAAGNTYLTGTCYGRLAMGRDTLPAPPARSVNLFLSKIDTAGTFLWTRVIGVSAEVAPDITGTLPSRLRLDAQGNVYLAAEYTAALTIAGVTFPDPGGNPDVFVAKWTPDGQPLWAQTMGSINTDRLNAFAVGPSGECAVGLAFNVGTFIGGQSYGYGGAAAYRDIAVAKLNANGSVAWVKGGGERMVHDRVHTLAVLPAGDVVSVLNMGATGALFGGQPMPATHVFVRLDRATGQQKIARTWFITAPNTGPQLCADGAGNLYFSDDLTTALNLGNGVTLPTPSNGNELPMLAMLTSNGEAVWAISGRPIAPAQVGTGNYVETYNITSARDGSIYVRGICSSGFALGNDTIRTAWFRRFVKSTYAWKVRPPLTIASNPTPLYACPGATFALPFTALPGLAAGNQFTAQLSDSLGSFATPVAVGTLAGTSSGSIPVTIPAGTPVGRYYQLRVVTSAGLVSTGGTPLRILTGAYAAVTVPAGASACTGTPLQGTGSLGASYQWLLGGQPIGGATTLSYTPTQAGQYALQVTASCGTVTSAPVSIQALPTVTHTGLPPVALGVPSFTLTGGTPAGGTYAGPGVTNNVFNPGQAGTGVHRLTYTYRTSNGCAGSATVTQEVRLSLPTRSAQSAAFALFPNPATTTVLVQLLEPALAGKSATLEVCTSLGQVVRRATVVSSVTGTAVSLQGLAAGVYQVRVSAGDQQQHVRLVVAQ